MVGPLLFLLYINDVTNITDKFKYTLFADDTTLSASGPDIRTLSVETNDGLCRLHTWALANRISINPDKTVFNIVSNLPQPDHHPPIILDHCEIAINNEITYLGILVDSKLKFNLHIKYVGNKMSKAIGIMSKIIFFYPQAYASKIVLRSRATIFK